ncbi:TetR/AcrR family transcriptional regulator [Trinickia acidisoli]|uniref:TetR/AcrR family transcriptional regulator n=1 Tax=Trinickia acidisoli TaxID=2767482 RepID=UPI001A8EFFE1|nr:TetR/AcrR family transcriptional regulator [Trinickia acidisoli]
MTFSSKTKPIEPIAVRRKPRQGRSHMTVDAILEAARQLFASDGFDATSTTRIAEAAGVSVGSLYEYFTSKEALAAKLIKRHCDHLLELYAQAFKAVEGQGIEAAVAAWVDTTIDAYAEDVALQRALLEQIGRVSKLRHLSRVSLAITDLLEQALQSCGEPIQRPNIHLAAFIVESAVEALTHRSILYAPELFSFELRRDLKIMATQYLRTPTIGLGALVP